jgi:hypothetical protein
MLLAIVLEASDAFLQIYVDGLKLVFEIQLALAAMEAGADCCIKKCPLQKQEASSVFDAVGGRMKNQLPRVTGMSAFRP